MPRKKADPKPAIETAEQLGETVDEIATLEVTKRLKVAARDQAVQAVHAEHDGPIVTLDNRIKSLMKLAGTYAIAHKATLFDKLKSALTKLARYGLRETPEKLCTLNKKTTWETVMATLKAKGETRFIRTVEEVDKDAIKAAKLSDAELAALGLRLDNNETFFVESKAEEAQRLKTQLADPEAEAA